MIRISVPDDYIETDPEQARCELHGQDFVRVVNTPDSLHLPAKAAPITIACEAENYRLTTQSLNTKMDGWIFGNIIFGGVVGAVIDASRGAGQKYPPHVMVFLEPDAFVSEKARDEWYRQRKAALEEEWDRKIDIITTKCPPDADCSDRLDKAQEAKEQSLIELEEIRARSEIRPSGTSRRDVSVSGAGGEAKDSRDSESFNPYGRWNVVLKQAQGSCYLGFSQFDGIVHIRRGKAEKSFSSSASVLNFSLERNDEEVFVAKVLITQRKPSGNVLTDEKVVDLSRKNIRFSLSQPGDTIGDVYHGCNGFKITVNMRKLD